MLKSKGNKNEWRYEFGGLAGAGVSLILFVGMLGYTSGIVVEYACKALRYAFGVGGFAIPVFSFMACILMIFSEGRAFLRNATISFALLLVASLGFIHLSVPAGEELARPSMVSYGGLTGALISLVLRKAFGDVGGYIVLSLVALSAILICAGLSPSEVMRFVRQYLSLFGASVFGRLFQRGGRRAKHNVERRRSEQRHQKGSEEQKQEEVAAVANAAVDAKVEGSLKGGNGDRRLSAELREPEGDAGVYVPHVITGEVKKKHRKQFKLLPDHYEKVVEALDKSSSSDEVDSEMDVEEGIKLVEETLASFKIDAKVVNVKRGPVITRYEVQPAPGIRVSRIANLADDLALALAAIDVRVEAPVPGKSVIGIEVPNKRVGLVRLRELLELDEFKSAQSKLTFALGKDIAGNPKLADLARMPHLLIGGATNSGKSVCLNSMIISLLSRADPDEVKFLLIDPKRVELSLFDGIPHLVHPVVVDAKHAVLALQCAVREMERRYELFAEMGVRNIDSYNASVGEDGEPLYHIVIVIDELADLMMQAPAEIERLICRLAQLARATGIHLVIATQRPSVNVITGVIKANIPSRIAFAVASQVDSRTILDMNGAERLIGRGDMLYHPIDAPKPIRLQGAFVSESELNRVVGVLIQEYGEPEEYPFDLQEFEEETELRVQKPEKRDPLFDAAVELVRRKGYASASMLQREFEIGYPRAAKIIDQMERAGIVGPPEGSKPRRVLIPFADGVEHGKEPNSKLMQFSDQSEFEVDAEEEQ
ncbi:MAG: DNA translocase FtsK 4TM domain-containing protein [Armatimonadota bacterium]|nr:DNA translocase FtsK [Armatimonadota bacterium]MDW8026528.1 DNA translocase FtsK 4TM domain-containing protein [Armatimonadota bacterium]